MSTDNPEITESTLETPNGIFGRNIGEVLSEEEFCALFSIGETTALKYRDSGEIKFFRVGRKPFYQKSDVLDFIERQKRG